MCGIAGVVLDANRERSHTDNERIKDWFTRLMMLSDARGGDASGAAVVNIERDSAMIKAPQLAKDLVYTNNYGKVLNQLDGDTAAILGHTRYASVGRASDNRNNHPIFQDPLLVIHNGGIRNAPKLRAQYEPEGEVDTAAMVAALHANCRHSALSEWSLRSTLQREIEGMVALAAVDLRDRTRVLFARDVPPLVFAPDTYGYGTWFASQSTFLIDGLNGGVDLLWYMAPTSVITLGSDDPFVLPKDVDELYEPDDPDLPDLYDLYHNGRNKRHGLVWDFEANTWRPENTSIRQYMEDVALGRKRYRSGGGAPLHDSWQDDLERWFMMHPEDWVSPTTDGDSTGGPF